MSIHPDYRQFLDGRVTLHCGDCLDVLRGLADCSIDSVVTDPPYALVSIAKRLGKANAAPAKVGATGAYARASRGFMGKQWDTGERAFADEFWREVWRVLKPGGHVLAFSATRTYHRLACAIEDGGFEIRDQAAWAYGSGFPKSHDVSKALVKRLGHWRGRAGAVKGETVGQVAKGTEYERTDKGEPVTDDAREWQGWGTALKPAWEPICVARKELDGTVADNVLKWGTGALNIDGCRIGDFANITQHGGRDGEESAERRYTDEGSTNFAMKPGPRGGAPEGRWPANILHDGSDEVLAAFPDADGAVSNGKSGQQGIAHEGFGAMAQMPSYADSGSAARFFYTAKADAEDRIGSKHPTVKPLDLIQYLCRLVTPPHGTVLDPFAGTGTTGEAAWREGFNAVLIEREAEYQADIARRMDLAVKPTKRAAVAKSKNKLMGAEGTPLFGGIAPEPGGGQTGLRTLPRSGRTIGPIGLKR